MLNKLIAWITPVIFLLSAQIAVEHGVFGLLGFSFLGALSFLFVYFLQKRRRYMNLDAKLKNLIYVLLLMEITACTINVVEVIVLKSFQNFLSIINISLIVFIIVIILFLQSKNRNWLHVSMIILGLIFSFLIPTLVYLKVSIPTVYSGLHFLANDMLRFDNFLTWQLLAVLGVILLSHQILYHLFFIKNDSTVKFGTYLVSSLIWLVVPISIGSLAFLAKAQAIWPELSDQVSVLVIIQFGGHFGQTILLVTCFFLLIGKSVIIWDNFKKRFHDRFALLTIFIVIIPLVIVLSAKITLLDILLFFGLIWSPLFGVILWTSTNMYINRIVLALGILLAFVLFTLYSAMVGMMASALFSFATMMVLNYTESIKAYGNSESIKS